MRSDVAARSPHRRLAVVDRWMVEGAPASDVFYDEPEHERSSGFFCISAEAPHADDAKDQDFKVVCLGCLIEMHPEIGRGLDLAKQHGKSWVDEHGEWAA